MVHSGNVPIMPSSGRSRSASPSFEEESSRPAKKQKSSGGFKWKSKSSRSEEEPADSRSSGRLERGYRDRSPRRDNYRRDREEHEGRDRNNRLRDEHRDTRRRDCSDDRRERDRDGGGDSYRPSRNRDTDKPTDTLTDTLSKDKSEKKDKKDKKDKKEKKPKQITSTEPMIVVNVNDRLGTKAAIPCLASDSVKAFKAMVAAHIGRQPHEIMLKRQGERPFKDQLTLEDYGVSNGVQLDLELDTGD